MRRLIFSVAALALAAFASTTFAQKTSQVHPGKAGSPHVKSEWAVDGATLSIQYGRPSLKGRVPGKDVDPYEGREWRTGADEATTLVTSRTLRFSDVSVPAGTYTLYTVPVQGTWHLVISKKTGQWGIPYPKGEDLGRAAMTMSAPSKAADQLTISVEDTARGATLHIDWGATRASIPFTVA